MLPDKYRPKMLSDMIGNREQVAEIRDWIAAWKKGKALLLYGPTGGGKSLAIELIAKEMHCELVESHASDNRSYRQLKESIMKASGQRSLMLRKKLILVDEIETLESVKGVIELIESSDFPVILIGTNPYEKRLFSLRQHCRLVKLGKVRHDVLSRFLMQVNVKEKLNVPDSSIYGISKACNGDVRSALIDLLYSCPAVREYDEDVFNTLKIIFRSPKIGDIREAVSNSDSEGIVQWLENNIPAEYTDPQEIASAYDFLSKADLFMARIIKRQSWSLQKYFIDMGILGVSASKKQVRNVFVSYARPVYRHNSMDGALGKISKKLHVSKKDARVYVTLVGKLSQKTDIATKLGLSEEDMELIK
ncbi:MAG: AAA family ATPase [Candidatus Aenigmarchaeota archaeon]|nr:AAA family ATPase [Candidatus Aenigmarchaeota archaeon]